MLLIDLTFQTYGQGGPTPHEQGTMDQCYNMIRTKGTGFMVIGISPHTVWLHRNVGMK